MPFPFVPLALAAGSALASGLAGKASHKGQYKQLPRFTGQQNQALDQLLSQGQQNSNFDAIENRARYQFQRQTIPSIAERFTSMGDGQRSSAFENALGQSSADLDSQLAALRSQYGMQQLSAGLTPRHENVFEEGGQGALGTALGGLSQGLGSFGNVGFGQYLGLFGNQNKAPKGIPGNAPAAPIPNAQVPSSPPLENPYAQTLSPMSYAQGVNNPYAIPNSQQSLLRGLL